MRLGGSTISVVDEHNKTFTQKGKVGVAKFGAPLSKRVIESMFEALAHRKPRLYLVTKVDDEFHAAAGLIEDVGELSWNKKHPAEDFFPAYYEKLYDRARSFVLVKTEFKPITLNDLLLASDGRSAIEVMQRSRNATMLVRRTAIASRP
jgi:hypothetical protein